jgi:preprotein translocase subunit SecA
VPAESLEEQWDVPGLQKHLQEEWQLSMDLVGLVQKSDSITDDDILEKVLAEGDAVFQAKLDQFGEDQFTPFMRMVLLQSIDSHWREHLAALDYLRQGIHLRGYAQKNPKQEYKREAFELFGQLLDVVKTDVTRVMMNVRIQSQEEVAKAAQALEEKAEHISNVTYTHPTEDGEVVQEVDQATLVQSQRHVGRNDPCPCGSGKKYKACHGKLA